MNYVGENVLVERILGVFVVIECFDNIFDLCFVIIYFFVMFFYFVVSGWWKCIVVLIIGINDVVEVFIVVD